MGEGGRIEGRVEDGDVRRRSGGCGRGRAGMRPCRVGGVDDVQDVGRDELGDGREDERGHLMRPEMLLDGSSDERRIGSHEKRLDEELRWQQRNGMRSSLGTPLGHFPWS